MVTPELVQDAFEHLSFTPAAASVQPVGGRTLVNLPTYFHATYPTTSIHGKRSVGPGQPATVTLLGHRVVITPQATSYRYRFDDGPALTSTDPGGPYPSGHITHTYTKPGHRTVGVDTTYGGTFTVDGGEPIPLQGTVTIPGVDFGLDVLTATNRLYANP